MIDLTLPPPPCVFGDWNPIAASSSEAAVAAVLGGFVFSGIVVILSTREKRQFEAAQALKLLLAAFLGFAITAYLLANDAGEQTCSRADSLVVVAGGPFGTFSFLMLVALTWLVAAYRDELEDVLKLLRALIYVASAFVVLLLCVSSQSYVSAEIGPHGRLSLSALSDTIYGVGAVAIIAAFVMLARRRLVWWMSHWRRWAHYLSRSSERHFQSEEQFSQRVNRCFYAAMFYLAVVGLGAGIVIGLPRNWYMPIHQQFVYSIALAALLAPVPVFVLAARALAQPSEHSVDKKYWEKRGAPETVALAERLVGLIRRVTDDDQLALRFNRYYIGLAEQGRPNNFITMYPRKKYLGVKFKASHSDELSRDLEIQGVDASPYDTQSKTYWLHLTSEDFAERQNTLEDLIHRAVSATTSESSGLGSLPEGNQVPAAQ